jgi:hypothetical protein
MKTYNVTVKAAIKRNFLVTAKNKKEAIEAAKKTEFSDHTDLLKYHWATAKVSLDGG